MKHPAGFPPHWHAPVERALLEAERELHRTLSALPAQFDRVAWDTRGNAALTFVLHVIAAVILPECEAIRQGQWSIPQSHDAVDAYLEDSLIPQAYRLARLSTYANLATRAFEGFRESVLARVQESKVWDAYLEALLAVADELTHSTSASATAGVTAAPNADGRAAETKTKDSNTTLEWRRERLYTYARRHGIEPEARFLASALEVSAGVYHALVRGDALRYSAETKKDFLKKLGVSAADWDTRR